MAQQDCRGRDEPTARWKHVIRAGLTTPTRGALVLTSVLILSVVAVAGAGGAPAAGATQGDVTTTCQLDRASPQAVVGLRERAQQRLEDLQRLKAESAVAVDQETIDSTANRMQNGNISYDRARYRRACGHYQIALDQSTAALERLYVALTEVRLESVESQLETRRAAGYDSMEMANLSARHEALAAQTANVSSLSQARAVASEAAELQAETTELPKMRVVRAATAFAPLWGSVPVGVGLSLVIGGIGAFVGRRTADTTASDGETDGPTEVEGTATRRTFDGTE